MSVIVIAKSKHGIAVAADMRETIERKSSMTRAGIARVTFDDARKVFKVGDVVATLTGTIGWFEKTGDRVERRRYGEDVTALLKNGVVDGADLCERLRVLMVSRGTFADEPTAVALVSFSRLKTNDEITTTTYTIRANGIETNGALGIPTLLTVGDVDYCEDKLRTYSGSILYDSPVSTLRSVASSIVRTAIDLGRTYGDACSVGGDVTVETLAV